MIYFQSLIVYLSAAKQTWIIYYLQKQGNVNSSHPKEKILSYRNSSYLMFFVVWAFFSSFSASWRWRLSLNIVFTSLRYILHAFNFSQFVCHTFSYDKGESIGQKHNMQKEQAKMTKVKANTGMLSSEEIKLISILCKTSKTWEEEFYECWHNTYQSQMWTFALQKLLMACVISSKYLRFDELLMMKVQILFPISDIFFPSAIELLFKSLRQIVTSIQIICVEKCSFMETTKIINHKQ